MCRSGCPSPCLESAEADARTGTQEGETETLEKKRRKEEEESTGKEERKERGGKQGKVKRRSKGKGQGVCYFVWAPS